MRPNWIDPRWLLLQRVRVGVLALLSASAVSVLAQYVASDAPPNGVAQKATALASFLVAVWAVAVAWMALTGRMDSKLKKARLLWRKPELVLDNSK